jgi:hypothetical protein
MRRSRRWGFNVSILDGAPFKPPIMVLDAEQLKALWEIGGSATKERTVYARELRRRIRILLAHHMIATRLEAHISRNNLRILWLESKAYD